MEDISEVNDNPEGETNRLYMILVVDDDEALSQLNQRRLQKAGFQTRSASSGTEAIAQISDNPPSLMLLDYKLPDVSGKRLVKTLIEKQISIPFIIMTGHGDEKVAVEMMKLGAKDYLVKDAGFLDLLPIVVKRVIEQITIENRLIESEKEAKRQLIEKSKELEDFVYIVSHDLKEPLFVIEGYNSRLMKAYKDILDEKGKLYTDRIKINIKKMALKISEIMRVVKAGKIVYDFKDNNSRQIVNDVIKMLESRISAERTNVIIQDNLPTLLCDEERIKDVLSNLIINAIKFMGNDSQRNIRIGCDKKDSYYKFFVEDTGIGIQKEYQVQIFKIFRRLNDVEAEGTGVGLAIVKKIIEMHKGTIWVESPVSNGRGSRFCFTLPITREIQTTKT